MNRIAAIRIDADHRLAGDRVVRGGEAVEQRGDRDRADRRPGPVPRAAEHAHQHDGQRHRDREDLAGRDVREEQRLDAARDARERARDRERDELVAVGRHAHHLGRVLVVVDREQAGAEARDDDRPGDQQRERRRGEREQVEGRRLRRPDAPAPAQRSARRPGRRRSAC